ncbi:MAG: hypothetical protein WCK70_20245 [Chloroflexales bacterium]
MATGNGRRSQAGGGKTVHYLSRTGNTAAKRQTSKTDRQTAKRQLRQEQGEETRPPPRSQGIVPWLL